MREINFLDYYNKTDYEELGITEKDINKYERVIICNPMSFGKLEKACKEVSAEFRDTILILTHPFMIEDEFSYIDDIALKRAIIINFLINKKENEK